MFYLTLVVVAYMGIGQRRVNPTLRILELDYGVLRLLST